MLTDQDYDRGYITEVDFYKRFPTCRDQEIYEDAAIVETMESFIGPHEFIPVQIKRSIVGCIPFKNAKLLA
jgi:hypothetical protein